MKPAVLALSIAILVAGCGIFRGGLQEVEEVDVLAFSRRIEAFYRTLEELPLETLVTFQDDRLRTHFGDQASFADYYASLATQVRRAQLRNGRVRRVEIVEFRFEGSDQAKVDVILRGRHERALHFWDVELSRTDSWRRIAGNWFLVPGKL